MNIIKLTSEHKDLIKPLFGYSKFMGVDVNNNYFVGADLKFQEFYHESFADTYLTGLSNYHAYGVTVNDEIKVMIGFYESTDDASWYWNQVRSDNTNPELIKHCLDAVIEHNESRGRLKFFSMFPAKYTKVYRRLAFSKYNSERYDSFDEYVVPTKNQCLYTMPWQILFNRTLAPVDTVVRCTFLKQQYRVKPVIGGNI